MKQPKPLECSSRRVIGLPRRWGRTLVAVEVGPEFFDGGGMETFPRSIKKSRNAGMVNTRLASEVPDRPTRFMKKSSDVFCDIHA
ncbi:hypothetical protein [Desulfovibrio inopinatus]|uniref:hypothetical protein n=1 Tax=Desulfovibrio inopinatus TaxID=102109 RepID=UPI0012EC5D29|nr:hypothetical protein [Desulfovibrio inopinatus]